MATPYRSMATNSKMPTIARPPAWRITPTGNFSVGRHLRCSQAGGSATSTSVPMFIVVPMDSTSSAASGVLASAAFLSSAAKAR